MLQEMVFNNGFNLDTVPYQLIIIAGVFIFGIVIGVRQVLKHLANRITKNENGLENFNLEGENLIENSIVELNNLIDSIETTILDSINQNTDKPKFAFINKFWSKTRK
jgi:hypothetical protein